MKPERIVWHGKLQSATTSNSSAPMANMSFSVSNLLTSFRKLTHVECAAFLKRTEDKV
jgi:hypothetical protein